MITYFFANNTASNHKLVDMNKYELKLKKSFVEAQIEQSEEMIKHYENRIIAINQHIEKLREQLKDD